MRYNHSFFKSQNTLIHFKNKCIINEFIPINNFLIKIFSSDDKKEDQGTHMNLNLNAHEPKKKQLYKEIFLKMY